MRNFDLSSLYRTAIGIDRLLNTIQDGAGFTQSNFPPYNVELLSEDRYRIVMAVAGFSSKEIEITTESSSLTVVGKKEKVNPDAKYIHRGIAERNFEQKFQLAEHVRVESAKCENGMLTIDCVRHVPEECKPRKIEIGSA
jgi:molecular chaperone IbpA